MIEADQASLTAIASRYCDYLRKMDKLSTVDSYPGDSHIFMSRGRDLSNYKSRF